MTNLHAVFCGHGSVLTPLCVNTDYRGPCCGALCESAAIAHCNILWRWHRRNVLPLVSKLDWVFVGTLVGLTWVKKN